MKNSAARKLKQVPSGYLVVGIDPHKKKHAAVAITGDLMVRTKFKFANSRVGFEQALENARAETTKAGCRGVIFAIETGGHFWRNFAYSLEEYGVLFRLISALTPKRRRDGRDLDRRKNDFWDAEMAAGVLLTGDFTETKLPQGVSADLRSAHAAYFRLVKERTRIINPLKGLLDGLFPNGYSRTRRYRGYRNHPTSPPSGRPHWWRCNPLKAILGLNNGAADVRIIELQKC